MIDISQLGSLSLEMKRELLRTLLAIQNGAKTGVYPLSAGQQALWFIYQLVPQSSAYHFLFAARLPTSVDHSALTRAFTTLIGRHDFLRTRFYVQDGKPVQKIEDHLIPTIQQHPGADLPWPELIEQLRHSADQPFDLSRGPAMRIDLYPRRDETVLLIVFHHLVADLWSMDILIDELKALYQAEIAGGAAPLPQTAGNFGDYLRFQLTGMHGSRGQQAWEYWQKELAGELPVLELPTDRPRPPVQSYRTANYTWPLNPDTLERLQRLAGGMGTTVMPPLLAAYQILLRKYSGQDELLVGVATADRGRPEWERLVGYFLNQIVVRNQLGGEQTFRDVVEATRQRLYRGLEHQDFPFSDVVRRLAPRRDPSRSAIFQTMFIWDRPRALPFPHVLDLDTPPQGVSGELTLDPLLVEQRGDSFDLTMIIFAGEERLTARLSYNTDLFDADTIEGFAQHFDHLLEQLSRSPDVPVAEHQFLLPTEQEELTQWCQSSKTPHPDLTFFDLFEQQLHKYPEQPAVRFYSEVLTYRELHSRSNRLARFLQAQGVVPGDLVAICLPRGLDMIVALFAIWKARAAWLFLDPGYPAARLSGMVEDAHPKVLLTSAEVPSIPLSNSPVKVLTLTNTQPDLHSYSDVDLEDRVRLEDRAYVIYTSGSTGKPKGTLLLHRGIVDLAMGLGGVMDVRAGERMLQFASLSFDASVAEMMIALGRGATLVLARQLDLLPGPGLVEFLREHDVNAVILPPSIMAALPSDPLPALRMVCLAGEACPAELVRRWTVPGVRTVVNAYGPTEVTVCATAGIASPAEESPSIGGPIGRMRLYVCDGDLQPVPVGVTGELLIGGPGLAEGYLGRPGLTAEKFIPDPFSADGGVLYRTGDHVRRRRDGTLDFLGRIDHQVKIRGHRIELDEIQEVLRRHQAVADAAVIVRQDAGKGPALAAYVVAAGRGDFPYDELRAYLRSQLPVFMLPGTITVLEQMPLTSNGKIDRKALLRILPSVQTSRHHEPPTTPTEKRLAQIWRRVLGVDSVGIHDNFFDLGGASIQTIEVMSLAAAEGLTVSPEYLFRYQTIAELAAMLPEVNENAASGGVPTPQQTPVVQTVMSAHQKTGAVIESLGAYLPERSVSTEDVLRGCQANLDFPLERFTGIRSRRMAGETEFAVDLAARAMERCLARSRHQPGDIDLLVCCNISRYDGAGYRFTLEPTTAIQLKKKFGLVNALAFDVTNACAGTFTAISIVDAMLREGMIKRALVVSGEYITHLTETAQREIKDFMDPRMACLTVGDAGVAMLLERAESADVGLKDVEVFTLGRYHNLCVARATTEPHGGAIMYTDPVKSAVVTTRMAVQHCLEVLHRNQWEPDDVHHLIMHQTSERTLDGAAQEINRQLGRTVVTRKNTIYNLAERGNCATNTHMLAVWENIQSGKINPGDHVLFAISGSGLNVGSALYTFDDLPNRLREPVEPRKETVSTGKESLQIHRLNVPVRIAALSDSVPENTTVEMLKLAGKQCLQRSGTPREEVDLVLHTGVHRTEYLSEPALATIAAGELGINHDDELPTGRRTLAFDLLNGGTGTLTGCFAASAMIQAGRHHRALLLASEVENNADVWPENLSGIRPTATAMLLERSAEEGFIAFGFRAFTEYVECCSAWTGAHNFRPATYHHRCDKLDSIYAECVQKTVVEFLQHLHLKLEDIRVVLPSWRSPAFVRNIGERLGVSSDRLIEMPDESGDYFTSSLACTVSALRRRITLSSDELALIVEVGAGVQVGCALYRGGRA